MSLLEFYLEAVYLSILFELEVYHEHLQMVFMYPSVLCQADKETLHVARQSDQYLDVLSLILVWMNGGCLLTRGKS